jgi:uncharacterized protein DUF4202
MRFLDYIKDPKARVPNTKAAFVGMTPGSRYEAVIAAIDAANATDPNSIEIEGQPQPAELIYGRRMSATLARMAPAASEALRIAARGQHIERWRSPRKTYPEGRAGYLKWRKDLKDLHAQRLAEIMANAGYEAAEIARVGALVRKEKLKVDADAQLLEDVVCVVFLEHYLAAFMAKTEPSKMPGILAKTWRKMSDFGHAEALKLDVPSEVMRLLERGLAEIGAER